MKLDLNSPRIKVVVPFGQPRAGWSRPRAVHAMGRGLLHTKGNAGLGANVTATVKERTECFKSAIFEVRIIIEEFSSRHLVACRSQRYFWRGH